MATEVACRAHAHWFVRPSLYLTFSISRSRSLSGVCVDARYFTIYIYIHDIVIAAFLFTHTMVVENETPAIRLRRKLTELSNEYSPEKQVHTRSKSASSSRPPPSDPNASLRYRRMRRKVLIESSLFT